MTSAEEFNCILCQETFDNKDELQNHFRKHGDPKFNESIKTKSRAQNEATFANEKSNDASEMVNCDVCDEGFPTISKAITHKHKVHPEHDAKYFCPWCGKLFTMKHLYNKHLHANHDATDDVLEGEDSHFHCDSCNVYFFIPAAMVYHNKFFHRQDSDLPIIGHSKKQKLVNQDLLPVYYCSFCGEEYINKVNLHKHMCDDHGDENQRPTDVLRCPLCEAVFYHLDAFELHLTFHTSQDLYSETNEMNEKEISEFSLETVPPVMERIENLNNLPDVETDMNAIGIESFLQMAMDEPKDSDQLPEKSRSKKHKKHKKSKKPAITLDEFLSMNQDVFGEDLDFQGIEEVPTKVITKQLKIKKPPVSKTGAKGGVSSAELQKLQKLGIAVKVKSGNNPPVSKVKPIGQPIKVNPQVKNLAIKTRTNTISASNEVLSKLLNQSSSQLKIVKKSPQEKESDKKSHDSELATENLKDKTETFPNDYEKEENGSDHKSNVAQENVPRISPTDGEVLNDEAPLQSISDGIDKGVQKQTHNESSNVSNNACIKPIQSPNLNNNAAPSMNNMSDTLKNIGKQITIKPIPQAMSGVSENTDRFDTSERHESDVEPDDINLDKYDADKNDAHDKNKAMNTLKNLNSAVTIKTLKNISVPGSYKNSTANNDKTEKTVKQSTTHNPENSPMKQVKLETASNNLNKYDKDEPSLHTTSPSQVLKNISKNIIKSTSPQIQRSKKDDTTYDEHNDSDFDSHEDDSSVEKQTINYVVGSVPSLHIASPSQVLKNISKNITITSMSPKNQNSIKDDTNDEHNDSDFDNPEDDLPTEKQNSNIVVSSAPDKLKNISTGHKLNPDVRIKSTVHSPSANNRAIANSKEDVTGDEKCSKIEEFKNPNIQSSINILKHLTNITAKSISTSNIVNQEIGMKSCSRSNIAKGTNVKMPMQTQDVNQEIEIFNIDDSDDDEEQLKKDKLETTHIKKELLETTHTKKEPIKADVTSHSVLNTIKNISKHITVKPANNQTKLKIDKRDEANDRFSDDDMHEDEYFDSNDDIEQNSTTDVSKQTSSTQNSSNKNDSFNNVLKQLGKHITVKSKNACHQLIKPVNTTSHDYKPDIAEDDAEREEDSYTGKVKITEITEDDDEIDHTSNCHNEGIVTQSPDDSVSGDEHFDAEELEETDECYSQNLKVRLHQNVKPSSCNEGLFKNISKNITVKSLSEKSADTEDKTCKTIVSEKYSIGNNSKLSKELSIRPVKQSKSDGTNDNDKSRPSNMPDDKRIDSPSSQSIHQKPAVVNTVNKEVKVKTFQSETVIEEITTTVTKTIRRVNQTVTKQQVFNASQVSSTPRMIRPQVGPRMKGIHTSNNLQGVTVRQSPSVAVRPKIRQAVPSRPVSGPIVRPSNQLVPIRPGVTPMRPSSAPRMQIKNMSRQPRPVGKPLKMSPNVINQTMKRPVNEELPGHFSCFKKPKESLIPLNEEPSSAYQYASSSQTSKFCSTTQTVKGNSVVTSTQIKSESLQQQHIKKLGNIAGLKVAKASRVCQVEKTEMNASKRTTLEAIEKLQKQGLLIKKPRVEEDSVLPHSDGEDNENCNDDFQDYDE